MERKEKKEMPAELKEKRMQQLLEMPIVESNVFKSKDGNFIIHKITITDIKSVKYYDAVMSNTGEKQEIV